MSQGKRLVLEDNDFIDEDDEQQQQTNNNNNNNSQKKVVGISSSSSSNNNNNGNGAQQGTIDSQLLRSSRPDVEKIISAHRQSLIGLQSGTGGSSSGTSGTVTADDLQKFNSITLSKRHLYSDTDYEKGLDLETFKKLSNFKFDSSAEANAKQQQQQQTNSNAGVDAEKK